MTITIVVIPFKVVRLGIKRFRMLLTVDITSYDAMDVKINGKSRES